MTEPLNTLVSDLARLRAEEAEADAEYTAAKAAFEAEHAALIERRKTVKARVDAADETVRHAALLVIMEDITDQRPHPAVNVKFVHKASFDRDEAREWAIRNMPALLTLDEKAYDKLLREWVNSSALASVFQMPGSVAAVPTVYIDRDLSAFAPVAGVATK